MAKRKHDVVNVIPQEFISLGRILVVEVVGFDEQFDAMVQLDDISKSIQGIWSDDINEQFDATTDLTDLLWSDERNDQIDELIEAGVLPRMVEFLQSHDHPQLQIEAARVLANIASGEHTKMVVDQGAISSFVELLSSANQEARNQAILALGSISSVSSNYRDLVLAGGALLPLLAQFRNISELTMQQNATKTLSELCRGTHTQFDVIGTLPILLKLIHSKDEAILYYACRALYHLLENDDGKKDRIQSLIDAGICPRLVQLIHHPSNRVVIAAVHTVGYIAEMDDTQAQVLMNNKDLLPSLYQLLDPNLKEDFGKEVCWVVSNFTSGDRHQIKAIIDSRIITRLVFHLKHSDIDIKREAARAISRTTERGSNQQMRYLVAEGCIQVFSEMLSSPEAEIVLYCLKVLGHILRAGEEDKLWEEDGTNPNVKRIKECGGFDKMKTLPDDPTYENPEVRKQAVMLIDNYFAED